MVVGAIFPEGIFPAGLFSGFPLYETSTPQIPPMPFAYKGVYEMDQIVGTTKKHPISILDPSNVPVPLLSSPVIYCRVNRGTNNVETFTLSEFDQYFMNYDIEVPATIQGVAIAAGDLIEIAVVDSTTSAYGRIVINVISDTVEVDTSTIPAAVWGHSERTITAVPTGGATSAEVAALNDLSAQQVWEYVSRGLTAIPTGTATATALSAVQGDITSIKSTVEGISVVGGTGAEKVIPRTYYELSAVENTITLSSPYNTITEEQIISICDLTTGDVIYSCEIPIKHTISVSSGVITFTYDNNSIAAGDILQIIVNQV